MRGYDDKRMSRLSWGSLLTYENLRGAKPHVLHPGRVGSLCSYSRWCEVSCSVGIRKWKDIFTLSADVEFFFGGVGALRRTPAIPPGQSRKSANQQKNPEEDIKDETVRFLWFNKRTAACSRPLNLSDSWRVRIMKARGYPQRVTRPLCMHRGTQCSQAGSSDITLTLSSIYMQSFLSGEANWVYKEKSIHLHTSMLFIDSWWTYQKITSVWLKRTNNIGSCQSPQLQMRWQWARRSPKCLCCSKFAVFLPRGALNHYAGRSQRLPAQVKGCHRIQSFHLQNVNFSRIYEKKKKRGKKTTWHQRRCGTTLFATQFQWDLRSQHVLRALKDYLKSQLKNL